MRASPVSVRPDEVPARAPVVDFRHAYALCVEKARRNIVRLAERPVAAPWAENGDYFAHPEGFFDIGNWTSSFHTGMALLALESTGEAHFLQHANQLAGVYRDKVTQHRMDTMHDLGFLYSLYSIALHRLTGDLEHHRTALLAADELARRFSAKGRYLQAWGRMDDRKSEYAGLAIIDSMMNLPLLFWAARETGSRFYSEIAVTHADTTRACFVRRDDSVFHAYRFDIGTGTAVRPEYYCGIAVDSCWARGMAWAIYGFALAYRHTHDMAYFSVARRLARRFVAQLDAESVPVWDFAVANDAPRLRDSSAAAVAVCALDEICAHEPNSTFSAAAGQLLNALCSADYLTMDPECPAVLRLAQIGDGAGRARNAFASWGDYFFMEALARRLHGRPHFW